MLTTGDIDIRSVRCYINKNKRKTHMKDFKGDVEMLKWYLNDWTADDYDSICLGAISRDKAIAIAQNRGATMTEYDRRRRLYFAVELAEDDFIPTDAQIAAGQDEHDVPVERVVIFNKA